MSRLMAVGYTERAVRDRSKTVTRRLGWLFLKPGDRVTLCRKVMGRNPGDPLERIAEVEIVDVRRVALLEITNDDIEREGVPSATWALSDHDAGCPECRPLAWAEWFARTMHTNLAATVTRIEWRYLADGEPDAQGGAA